MLKQLIFALFLLVSFTARAQEEISNKYLRETQMFLRHVYRTEINVECSCDTISLIQQALVSVYKPHIYTTAIVSNKVKFRKDYFPVNINNKIRFTTNERNSILNWLYNKKPLNWTNILIPNANFIDIHALGTYWNNNRQAILDRFPNGVFEFSSPLFLRNYTVCLFYWGHSCFAACGYGHLSIYIKQVSGWTPLTEIYEWEG